MNLSIQSHIKKLLFHKIPNEHVEGFRKFCDAKNATRLPYFCVLMMLHRLLATAAYMILYPILLGLPAVNIASPHVLYSIFYFVFLILASYTIKEKRHFFKANKKLTNFCYIVLITILFIDSFVTNRFFSGIFNPFSFLGAIAIIALVPLFDRRTTNFLLAFYLAFSMVLEVVTRTPAEAYIVHLVYNAFLTALAILVSSIARPMYLKDYTDQLKAATQNERLRELSLTDGLTKISNRRAFDEYLNYTWNSLLRTDQVISIIMFDLDKFKLLNDHLGHLEGDKCLIQVAQTVSKMFRRKSDMFARYGGEEFCAVIINHPGDNVYAFADDIRVAVENLKIPNPAHTKNPYITISVGVASGTPQINLSPSSLVKLADLALYQAKEGGRNMVAQSPITLSDQSDNMLEKIEKKSATNEVDNLRLIAEGSGDYSFIYDCTANTFLLSESFAKDFGLPSCTMEDGINWVIKAAAYDDGKSNLLSIFAQVLEGKTDHINFRIPIFNTSAQSIQDLHVRGKCKRSVDGRPLLIGGTINNITEQVSCEKISTLMIEGCSDCTFVFDLEQDIYEFSENIHELIDTQTNIFKDGAIDKWLAYVESSDQEEFKSQLYSVILGETDVFRMELRLKGKDGNLFWVACYGKASFDTGGKAVFIAGALIKVESMQQFLTHLGQMRNICKLSGMPNRLAFNDDFNHNNNIDEAHTKVNKKGYAIMVDIDDFNKVNSRYGLSIGDGLITEYSKVLISTIPDNNRIYHFEGDRFVILTESSVKSDIDRLCWLIHLYTARPLAVGKVILKVTVSIGAAEFSKGDALSDLILNTELALVNAKQQKNSIKFFDLGDKVKYLTRLSLEDELREAVADEFKGFELYYQPIFSTSLNMVAGAEALLRWRNKEGDIVPPGTVIPILQNIGIFSEVEMWILENAVEKCRKWIDLSGFDNFFLSINISPERIENGRLAETSKRILSNQGLDFGNIFLELTEESFVSEQKSNKNTFFELEEMGALVAIDDFGTGYSSLSYLRNLPVCEIKIDRSFIVDIETNENNKMFVENIIALSHTMNCVVCVEGVETLAQARILTKLNADFLQGYYFGRPVPPLEFEKTHLQDMQNPKKFEEYKRLLRDTSK